LQTRTTICACKAINSFQQQKNLISRSRSGVGKYLANPVAQGDVVQKEPHEYAILKFIVQSLGLDCVLLTEGNILDPRYEIREQLY
jgi:hypothetical protein